MSERFCFYELHARTLLGMPDSWRIASLTAHSHDGNHARISPKDVIEVRGGVFPLKTRGKNAGQPNWKKPEPGTKRSAYFTLAAHQEFLEKWEAETGKCSTCFGTTQEWAGWSVKEGTKYRPCTRCGATGKPPQKEIA